jgi:isoleucyl-tRNA synthetase
MLDTKGPEYRIGTFAEGKIEVNAGDTFTFTTDDVEGDISRVSVNYKDLIRNLSVGDRILVNNGLVIFEVKELDGNDVMDTFERGENFTFTVEDTEVVLSKDDVLAEATQKPGFAAQSDNGVTVVFDCNLTPELIAEGYQREVVSKLQTMRKEADFEVSDRIAVAYQADEELSAAIEAGKSFIMQSVLAEAMDCAAAAEGFIAKEWNINGKKATLAIRKA